MSDEYGSVLREQMKESMKYPAGFKSLNRREPHHFLPFLLICLSIVLFGVVGTLILDRIEPNHLSAQSKGGTQ